MDNSWHYSYSPKKDRYWAVLWCRGSIPAWKHADIITLTRNGQWKMMG
jgi:hypothetical protein